MTVLIVDGACLGNPGPGGWAAIIRSSEGEVVLSGGCPESTNNRMELTALREGLRALPEGSSVTVVTDSEYLRGTLGGGWRRRANHDLLAELDELLRTRSVTWEMVRGHSGHPDNERVDRLARAEAERARSAAAAGGS
jgi:ribonuclease HI